MWRGSKVALALVSGAALLGMGAAMVVGGSASAETHHTRPSSTKASQSLSQLNFTGSTAHPFVTLAPWYYPDGYNPLETDSLTSWYQTSMVDPPLAFVSRININKVIPAIASHWSLKGNTLSIFINPKARWSNGKPVTSADVVVSLDISLYIDQWMGLSAGKVTAVNSHEVQVTKGSLFDPYFVNHVLGYTPVYSAAEFAHFIPKDIYHLFLLSNQSNKAGKATKAASNASTYLTNLLKKMEAADPNLKISCGPWEIQSNSTSEALFKPNPYWIDPKAVPEVELLNSNSTNEIMAWADQGLFTLGGVPNPNPVLVKQWLRAAPTHKVIYNAFWGNVGLAFDTDMYPYNLLKVRQALAYAIDRTTIAHVANPLQAFAIAKPVGYFDYIALDKWLTAKQRSELNSYSYNPAKAKSLLLAAGFKHGKTGWLMPNGKPFVADVYAENTNPPWEAAAEVIKSNLSKIGVTTNVYFVAPAVYSDHLAEKGAGAYAMAIGWEAFSVHSYNDIVDALDYTDGVFLNYGSDSYTTGAGDIGLFPMTLPNGTPINIAKLAVGPNGLYRGSGAAKAKTMWEISEAANYELPMLPLWGQNVGVNYVNTEYYTGFPSGAASDPWWVLQNNLGPNWVAWFYEGIIHPTKALSQ